MVLKNKSIKELRAYKDMEPTYEELAKALKKLKFIDKSTSDTFVYINKKFDSIILLKKGRVKDLVHKANFASMSWGLEEQGVFKHEHDLGKMIEKFRLEEQAAAA